MKVDVFTFTHAVKHECGYVHKPNEQAYTELVLGLVHNFDIKHIRCNGCNKIGGKWFDVSKKLLKNETIK